MNAKIIKAIANIHSSIVRKYLYNERREELPQTVNTPQALYPSPNTDDDGDPSRHANAGGYLCLGRREAIQRVVGLDHVTSFQDVQSGRVELQVRQSKDESRYMQLSKTGNMSIQILCF